VPAEPGPPFFLPAQLRGYYARGTGEDVTSFIVLKFLAQLATPLGVFVVALVVAAALALLRFPRLGRVIAALAIMQLIVFSFGPVSEMLLRPLEDMARREAAAAPTCCYNAIVVLGGGIGPAVPPLRPDPELFDSSDRIWHAARLFHRGVAPRIIVSGGAYAVQTGQASPSQTEAVAMRQFLLALGVPDDRIVMEEKSLNTIENMRETHALVGAAPVALVTSAYHMPRALRLAREAGLNAAAFPTDWQILPGAGEWWERLLPSVGSLAASGIALKEYLALAFDFRSVAAKAKP
jgi:uncharacterized SAM-binding protein YcdF (DUF218 family)